MDERVAIVCASACQCARTLHTGSACPCLNMQMCADTSLHVSPSWMQEVIMSMVRLWGMEMLAVLEEWHIGHKEVWDMQALRVIKQLCGRQHCPLHRHCRHKSLASGVWRRCHLEKCSVKTMRFQWFLQNSPSAFNGDTRLEKVFKGGKQRWMTSWTPEPCVLIFCQSALFLFSH